MYPSPEEATDSQTVKRHPKVIITNKTKATVSTPSGRITTKINSAK